MLIRLPLYIALGITTEVLFTGIMDLVAPRFLQSWNAKNLDRNASDPIPIPIRRDPRAMGYTFLWMIPLYATLIVIEPLSRWLAGYPFWIRGLVYLSLFWIGEFASGAFIKKITGYDPWDYSYSRFSFRGHIRWDFAPFWFSFALFVEWISHKFILITPALKSVFGF